MLAAQGQRKGAGLNAPECLVNPADGRSLAGGHGDQPAGKDAAAAVNRAMGADLGGVQARGRAGAVLESLAGVLLGKLRNRRRGLLLLPAALGVLLHVCIYLSGLLASDFPDNPGNMPGKAVVSNERGKVQKHSSGSGLCEGKLAGVGHWRGLHWDRLQRTNQTA